MYLKKKKNLIRKDLSSFINSHVDTKYQITLSIFYWITRRTSSTLMLTLSIRDLCRAGAEICIFQRPFSVFFSSFWRLHNMKFEFSTWFWLKIVPFDAAFAIAGGLTVGLTAGLFHLRKLYNFKLFSYWKG